MSTFSVLPGTLNVRIMQGDTFSCTVDFTADLTGHTVVAGLYATPSGGLVSAITTTVVSAGTGVVLLSLTPEQTAAIPDGTYQFTVSWVSGGVARTALSGFFEITPRGPL